MDPLQSQILHFDLDAFFVAVECKMNPRLKGRPLIVGGSSRRGVVAACSYEARRFGVHSAMPMYLALQLCPDATVISGDMELYSRHSQLVTEVIADRAPLFEKSSIDEFYIDASGMDRFFGTFRCELYNVNFPSGPDITFDPGNPNAIDGLSTDITRPHAVF